MVFCFCGLVHHRISQSEVGADRRRDADILVSEKHLHRTSLVEAAGQTGSGGESEGRSDEDFPLVSETERKGYIALAGLCLTEEMQKKLAPFFGTLKDYSDAGPDWEYGSTLHCVMEYMEESHIFFLMGLDWKQDVETLEWRIESALTGNFGMSADLPDFRTYGNKSISAPSVFADYDNALRREGFQLGFIDVECDEYVIFVHRTADRDKAEDAVQRIGYRYKEVADLAI